MDNNKTYSKKNMIPKLPMLSILFILAGSGLAYIYPLVEPGAAYAQNPNLHSGSSDPSNENFYDPTGVSIKVGDKVMWKNNDISIHNLASGKPEEGPTSGFESGIMQAGSTFEHTFNNAGSIDYYCTIHPWMTGIVTVT